MKTSLRIRIITMSLAALAALGFASKTFASVNAYLEITGADGKITKVDLAKDGSFATPPLKAGRVKVKFYWDRSSSTGNSSTSAKSATLNVSASPGGSAVASQAGVGRGISSPTGGGADRESSAPSVSEVTMTYQIQSPRDAHSGMASGKVAVNPFSITKKIDKASTGIANGSAFSMNFEKIEMRYDNQTISGKIVVKDQHGKTMAMDDWHQ